MNVLSLFDGMSCGQIALKELGIVPNIYYASEIDKFAIAQTQLNFPNTIQLGSVTDVNVNDLNRIDLLIGGSPCQAFSFAGKRNGMSTTTNEEIYTLDRYLELKHNGFQFEGQSYLFWEYMRILTEIRKCNPEVKFLLENVAMGKKWERVLSEAIGVYGVHINSALVSGQNRKRIYWTNIKTRQEGLFGQTYSDIPQPKDRGIFLRDILEDEVQDKYYLSDKAISRLERARTDFKPLVTPFESETRALIRGIAKGGDTSSYIKVDKQLNTIAGKDNLVIQLNPSKESGGQQPYQQNRIYGTDGKSPALMAQLCCGSNAILDLNERQIRNHKDSKVEARIRRLTPTECARLQTIPDWYKWDCSDTQQYSMLGNGWTVEVIKHIFSFLSSI